MQRPDYARGTDTDARAEAPAPTESATTWLHVACVGYLRTKL